MTERPRRAFVTGVTGQLGAILAERLLAEGWEVHGMLRRHSLVDNGRVSHLYRHPHEDGCRFFLHYGDLADAHSIHACLRRVMPDLILNCGAQSHVGVSFELPEYTADVTGLGAQRVFEAAAEVCPGARSVQMSSVTGDTPVLVKTPGSGIQLVAIEDLVGWQNFEVFTHDPLSRCGRFSPVSSVLAHGMRACLKIRTTGRGEIGVTEDHSLFVWSAEGPIAVEASSLKVGDVLVTYCGNADGEWRTANPSIVIDYQKSHKVGRGRSEEVRVAKYRRTIPVTPDVARLCGFYLAEGCCGASRASLTFGLDPFDAPRVGECEKIAAGLGWHTSTSLRPTSATIHITRKEAVAFFSAFGSCAHEKRIPPFVWTWPRALIIEFLRGYLGDAKVEDAGYTIFTTISLRLQREVVYLCRLNGIPARPYSRKIRGHLSPQGTFIRPCTVYDVHVPAGYLHGEATPGRKTPSSFCVPTFAVRGCGIRKKLIGVRRAMDLYGEASVPADPGLGSAEIVSIERTIDQPVYDLAVPGSERFFCGNVPLLAHNSSEMFGTSPPPQWEDTPFRPVSPYGRAKVFAHHAAREIRIRRGLDVRCVMAFNYEGPTRGQTFVTRKVTQAVGRIAHGLQSTLYLGNPEAIRDWGWANDTADAVLRVAAADEAGDWVVATGDERTVEELVVAAFAMAGLDHRRHVVWRDPRHMRPVEVPHLRGDSSRIRAELGWKPTKSFAEILRAMVDADMEAARRESALPIAAGG